MDIHVVCEACGTELETPDASVDNLLTVVIQARPCPKCNRPPDCHLSCEDVSSRDGDIIRLKEEIKTWKQKLVVSLHPKAEPAGRKVGDHKPKCFGTHHTGRSVCEQCAWRIDCKATNK